MDRARITTKNALWHLKARMTTPPNFPITFRLPKPRERDALFNLSRATYYALESDGQLKLIRLRQKGRKRGTTLVSTAEVLAVLEAAEKGKGGARSGSSGSNADGHRKRGSVRSAPSDTGAPAEKKNGPRKEGHRSAN